MQTGIKSVIVLVMVVAVSGCLSAGTNAKLCTDLGFFGRVANAISSKIGNAVKEYTPKKCLNGGISGDAGNVTGGVNLGITTEKSETETEESK